MWSTNIRIRWFLGQPSTRTQIIFNFLVLTPPFYNSVRSNIFLLYLKQTRIGKTLFRKRSDKMRKELEDAAREGSSRRSNSPIPAMPLERAGSLSDLTGNAKAAGFFSDGIPKNIHMKFVSILCNVWPTSFVWLFWIRTFLGCPRRRSECSSMESCRALSGNWRSW